MLRTKSLVVFTICLLLSATAFSQSKVVPATSKSTNAARKIAPVGDTGRHLVRLTGKAYFLDRSGKIAIQCKCEDAYQFSDGLAVFYRDDKFGYLDRAGREVIAPKFSSADSFSDGLAAVATDDEHYIFIDKTGKQAIAKVFYGGQNSRSRFHEGLAPVLNEPPKNDEAPKYGYIDKTGQLVVPFVLDRADSFSGGMAYVRLNGKGAVIDRDGNFVKKNLDDEIGSFSEGVASFKRGEKCGYIDSKFKLVIEPTFYSCAPFQSGMAVVSTAPTYNFTFIDHSGKILTDKRYEFILPDLNDGRWGANVAAKQWVFLDTKLQQSPPATYEAIEAFADGIANVFINGESVFITTDGKIIHRVK